MKYQTCFLTGLCGKYPAGLKSEPELSDLMNEVAAVIPDKWQQVGIVLNMSDGDLASFVQLDSHKCFISVFTTWKNKQTSPYTWQTVVKALQSPTVGENGNWPRLWVPRFSAESSRQWKIDPVANFPRARHFFAKNSGPAIPVGLVAFHHRLRRKPWRRSPPRSFCCLYLHKARRMSVVQRS